MSRNSTQKKIDFLNSRDGVSFDTNSDQWLFKGQLLGNTNDAYLALQVADADAFGAEIQSRKTPVRVDPEIAKRTLILAQYVSHGYGPVGVWGDDEVSIDKLKSMVAQSFRQQDGREIDTAMVAKYINTMKRKGDVISTRKGYFHAAEQSKIDYSIFFA